MGRGTGGGRGEKNRKSLLPITLREGGKKYRIIAATKIKKQGEHGT